MRAASWSADVGSMAVTFFACNMYMSSDHECLQRPSREPFAHLIALLCPWIRKRSLLASPIGETYTKP